MEHETSWHTGSIRSAKTSGHFTATIGQDLRVCGSDTESLFKLGCSLDASLPQGRAERAATSACSGTTLTVVLGREAETENSACARSAEIWLLHGIVDPKTYRGSNPETFSDSLSPPPYLAADAGAGLELAEAGKASHGEKAKSHRRMETNRLAGYKKKPENLRCTSSSLTKVGFCSSRMSVRPGLPWARPPTFGTAIEEIKSPPLPASPSLPNENDWDSIFASMRQTFPTAKSWDFCDSSSVTCRDISCSCGMEANLIGINWSRHFFNKHADSISIPSPDTPRNSTRKSLSGPKPKEISPTAPPNARGELKKFLLRSFCRIKRSQRLLWSCIHASKLPWP